MNTMKKMLVTLGLTAALASPAMALTIKSGSVDVGSVDTVIGVSSLANSSTTTESTWIASILGAGYGVTANVNDPTIFRTNGSGTSYALDLTGQGSPTYVLVKNGTTYLLLTNTASLDYLVFNWAGDVTLNGHETEYDLNGEHGSNSGQTSISHYAIVTGPGHHGTPPAPSVPEPATLGLMGFGLVAAGLRGRRRKAA